MQSEVKNQLCLKGKTDKVAAAIRFKAARLVTGLSQTAIGERIGVGPSQISNVEAGLSYPSWGALVFLYEEHRVNVDFIVAGDYAKLPLDVAEPLFEKLETVHGSTRLLAKTD